MTDWLDVALVYDAETRRADLALTAAGDLLLDETPATPMLVAFGSDRRARSDDELPTGISEINRPSSLVERRGWAGDALDGQGERIGSRLWLLDRAKQSDLTRLMAAEWMKEAFGWVEADTGEAAVVTAEWARHELLALSVTVDGRSITINKRVA